MAAAADNLRSLSAVGQPRAMDESWQNLAENR
jgi:hypothetical protein